MASCLFDVVWLRKSRGVPTARVARRKARAMRQSFMMLGAAASREWLAVVMFGVGKDGSKSACQVLDKLLIFVVRNWEQAGVTTAMIGVTESGDARLQSDHAGAAATPTYDHGRLRYQ